MNDPVSFRIIKALGYDVDQARNMLTKAIGNLEGGVLAHSTILNDPVSNRIIKALGYDADQARNMLAEAIGNLEVQLRIVKR